MQDCYSITEAVDLQEWLGKFNDCHFTKTEEEIFEELKKEFQIKKASRYLYKLCTTKPSKLLLQSKNSQIIACLGHCGTGDVALRDACMSANKFTKENCEGLVSPIIAEFCNLKYVEDLCKKNKKNEKNETPAVVLSVVTNAVVQATEESATKKGKINLLLIGGGIVVVAFVMFGIAMLIFCLNSSPPPPPPVVNVRTTQTMKKRGRNKRKGKKKSKGKKSGNESKMKDPVSKKKKKSSEVKDPTSSKKESPSSEKVPISKMKNPKTVKMDPGSKVKTVKPSSKNPESKEPESNPKTPEEMV
ncbi:hypothetical protein CRE_28600 [Caenorhabditis remanei]|uniref:Uncharacterized protein n=1 Tax=Caenorhabditis remanei TaxID=31234 RepID=E3LLT2_CAERE|nr:hypothetical protein CRE_28600 [Caenorhabditis remanei]